MSSTCLPRLPRRSSLVLAGLSFALVVVSCAGPSLPPAATSPTDAESLRIIDIHAHLGGFEGYDLSLPTLLEYIETSRIELALVSNIDGAALEGVTADDDETTANRVTLEAVRRHERLRGVAWARPADGSAQSLEPFLEERLSGDERAGARAFVAVKLHPNFNQFPADDPRVDPYLELCARHGVPAVFHAGPPGSHADAERIVALARRHPSVPVVLYHLGWKDAQAALRAVSGALADGATNLYVGTAQAEPDTVVEAIRVLGAERVLFGTDATYYGREHSERVAPLVERLRVAVDRGEIEQEDLDRVLRENARRIFPLD